MLQTTFYVKKRVVQNLPNISANVFYKGCEHYWNKMKISCSSIYIYIYIYIILSWISYMIRHSTSWHYDTIKPLHKTVMSLQHTEKNHPITHRILILHMISNPNIYNKNIWIEFQIPGCGIPSNLLYVFLYSYECFLFPIMNGTGNCRAVQSTDWKYKAMDSAKTHDLKPSAHKCMKATLSLHYWYNR